MAFEHKIGDIFTTQMPAIGHGVNVYGMMGAGIAKLIANRFPQVLAPYKQACRDKSLVPGSMQFVRVGESPDKFILNMASQRRPGKDARLEWIESSAEASFRFAKSRGLAGFALPRIGSNIGGLDWHSEVKPLLERLAAREEGLLIELWSLPDAD